MTETAWITALAARTDEVLLDDDILHRNKAAILLHGDLLAVCNAADATDEERVHVRALAERLLVQVFHFNPEESDD